MKSDGVAMRLKTPIRRGAFMEPSAAYLLDNLSAQSLRYIIPVFQRKYAWDEEQCRQLWDDIVAVGNAESGSHFTGSIVWVRNGEVGGDGGITALLIDGQQRLTTLSLLLLALADFAQDHEGRAPDGEDLDFFAEDICNDYLLHKKRSKGPDRYKITLSEEDNETYHSLIEHVVDASSPVVEESQRILDNYEFFRSRLSSYGDPNAIWRGVRRLQVISVSLSPGDDNPQLIFESMNSTGKDLAASDLVRNFVLMGLPVDEQNRLYEHYWRRIERTLQSAVFVSAFDEFLQDYLTIRNAPEAINRKDIYPAFKRVVIGNDIDEGCEVEGLLGEMLQYAGYYARVRLGSEQDALLRERFDNLVKLGVTVVDPLLMHFCSLQDSGRIERKELVRLLDIAECYLMRRAVCSCATNSLNKFFPSCIAKLEVQAEIGSESISDIFRALLELERGTARRFPDDAEFAGNLAGRNVYAFKKALYLLYRLENARHAKNPTDFFTGQFTIEHIMPQNALAHGDWIDMLGGEAEAARVHAELLHNVGNLTVTAYNSELSDGTFSEKKSRMVGGFGNDVVLLSQGVAAADEWNEAAILARRDNLVADALQVWGKPVVDETVMDRVSAQAKPKSASARAETFRDLFANGFVNGSTVLVHEGRNGRILAYVTEDGRIRIENEDVVKSPSVAAIRSQQLRFGGVSSRNGWRYWRVMEDGRPGVMLDDLRLRAAAGLDVGIQTEEGICELRASFWGGLYEYASEYPGFSDAFGDLSERVRNTSHYCDLSCGTSRRHVCLMLLTRPSSRGVAAQEWFDESDAYPDFWNRRAEINRCFDTESEPEWDEPGVGKKSRSVTMRYPLDVTDPDTWEEAYEWLVRRAWELRTAFA